MKILWKIFRQGFLCFIILLNVPAAFAFEQITVGQTVFVACEKTPIHSRPTGLSSVVGESKFGEKHTVAKLEALFELPNSDFSSKRQLENEYEMNKDTPGYEPVTKKQYTRAAWIGIGDGRFLSGSCLVSKSLFGSQTIEKSKEKLKKLNIAKGKRGFSEDESGDLRAMRGAAGKAKAGRANYKVADEHITASQGEFDLGTLESFRREGKLGEFK